KIGSAATSGAAIRPRATAADRVMWVGIRLSMAEKRTGSGIGARLERGIGGQRRGFAGRLVNLGREALDPLPVAHDPLVLLAVGIAVGQRGGGVDPGNRDA